MARFTTHTIETAPASSKPILEQVKNAFLVRVFDAGVGPSGQHVSRLPRGITVGPDRALYSSGADNVVRFDLQTRRFDRLVVDSPGILAQSIIFIPKLSASCSQTTGSAAAQRN